jgi:hypothetical protein
LADLFDDEGVNPHGAWRYSLVNQPGSATNLAASSSAGIWSAGWLDSPWNHSSSPTPMGGWVWPDGSSNHPPTAYGYSWNATHDSGWAAHVGFEAQQDTPFKMRVRSNGASASLLRWTNRSGRSLQVKVRLDWHRVEGAARFGVWSTTSNGWVGDATHNPVTGTGATDAEPRTITDTAVVAAGQSLVFSSRSVSGASMALIDALTIEPAAPELRLDKRMVNGEETLAVSFEAFPGRIYALQSSTDLKIWTTLANYVGNGVRTEYPNVGGLGGASRFFRLSSGE